MSKNEIKAEELIITQPQANGLYHVFGNDKRSLCGKFMMVIINPEFASSVTGGETYKKGQDCKSCFKKANLKTE